MKKIKLVNFLLVVVTSILGIIQLTQVLSNNGGRVATCLVLFPILLVPLFLRKVCKVKINPVIELLYLLFVIVAQFLGSVINLYDKIEWFDLFAHTLSGFFTALMAIFLMIQLGRYQEKNLLFNLTYIFGIVFLVAGLWEFFEYGSDVLVGSNLQHAIETGVHDTMDDMLVAFLGSVIFAISYSYEVLKKKKLVIRTLIDYMEE